MFQKAIKRNAKGRVALIGPAGAGKSFTMLALARALAGPQGKIAAQDTEHGSLSKYADLFDFDVAELDSFTSDNFLRNLKFAEDNGYSVFCTDSLSHFWVGKDGALEFVDMAAKRHRDNMGGWKDFRPHERAMIDAMIASPCHIICTMRTKTDYVEEVNPQGKKVRRKVGLAPVQRDGLEYEFDLVGYMDEDNSLIIDKTRCPFYSQKALTKPGAKEFAPFIDWLKGSDTPKAQTVKPGASAVAPAAPQGEAPPPFASSDEDFPSNMGGTWVDPQPEPSATARLESARKSIEKPWQTFKEMLEHFADVKGQVGDQIYYHELTAAGVKHSNEFARTRNPSADALACYQNLLVRRDEIAADADARAREAQAA